MRTIIQSLIEKISLNEGMVREEIKEAASDGVYTGSNNGDDK